MGKLVRVNSLRCTEPILNDHFQPFYIADFFPLKHTEQKSIDNSLKFGKFYICQAKKNILYIATL